MLRNPRVPRLCSAALSTSHLTTLVSVLAVAACGSSATTANGGAPANIVPWSGQDQVATVGTAVGMPIQVRVTDASGASVIGATVTLTASAGSLGATTGVTGDEGIFQTTMTLGTKVGADTVNVTVNGATTPAVFVFNATADAPATLAVVSGNNQAGAAGSLLASDLAVAVQDQYGNPVPNALVIWSADAGHLASSTSVTDINGVAQVAFTLASTPGTDNVTADTGELNPKNFVENAN